MSPCCHFGTRSINNSDNGPVYQGWWSLLAFIIRVISTQKDSPAPPDEHICCCGGKMVLQEVCDCCESSGLMSHGAACPAPPAADGTSAAAACGANLNGARLVASIPSKILEFLENSWKMLALNSGATTQWQCVCCPLYSQYNRVHCTSALPCLVWSHLAPTYRFNCSVTHKKQLYSPRLTRRLQS